MSETDLYYSKLPQSPEWLSNRFDDLQEFVHVHIMHPGFIEDLNTYGPYKANVEIGVVINLLNKGVYLEFDNHNDLIKMRNTLIYYNDYLCKEYPELRRATTAQKEIEMSVNYAEGTRDVDVKYKNPFTDPEIPELAKSPMDSISVSDTDAALRRYRESRKNDIKIKGKSIGDKEKEVTSAYEENCSRIADRDMYDVYIKGDDYNLKYDFV